MAAQEKNELLFRQFNVFTIFTRQFQNPLLLVLGLATLISYYFGEHTNAAVILSMMLISILMGFWNEFSAEKTVSDLLKKIPLTAVVIRQGQKIEIPIPDILVGDQVLLSAGSIVPADLKLNDTFHLQIDESVLTGESAPVSKKNFSFAYMGTTVNSGNAQGTVTQIGRHTTFGQISRDLSAPKPITKFQLGLNQFSFLLVKVISVLTVLIFLINFTLGHSPLDSLLFSLAIAIGLTPELFPVIVTISLSAGSRRLAKKQIITKQLVAIEDLGNMDILCSDKTGTLTEGKITLDQYFDLDQKPQDHLLHLGLLCNSAGPHDKFSLNTIDTAIWQYAHQNHVALPGHYQKIFVSQFDFDLRSMFAVVKNDQSYLYLLKGSPENVLEHCRLKSADKKRALEQFHLLSKQGVRVVALAEKNTIYHRSYSFNEATNLQFVGFLTFSDVPKQHISDTLNILKKLQVKIKVITGDNELVTAHICQNVGLPYKHFLLGQDLDRLSDNALKEVIFQTDFFARVSPEQKLRLITAYKELGHTVGYLGDGINDAPALHAADVGISVNSAVDIAKDAASIVTLNKDLSVLADGIIEGRKIFANTIKYVLMGTSSNFGNMFSAAAASFVLPFLPMTASQILLTNLLYDFSQLAIPTDNVDPETLQKPENWNIDLIKKYMLTFGPVSSLFDFATFGIMLFVFKANAPLFQTGWFIESLITEVMVIFLIRTKRLPFFTSRPGFLLTLSSLLIVSFGIGLVFTPLATAFGFVQPPNYFFVIMLIFTLSYLTIIESVKYFSKIV